VDYKKANNQVEVLSQLIKEVNPNGIDGYFDNVGCVTEAVNLDTHAKVYLCGAISAYPSGGMVVASESSKKIYEEKQVSYMTCLQATMAYLSNVPKARRELFSLMKEGKLCAIEWEMDGLENTAQTFEEMYGGKNYGKTIIKVFDE